MNNQEAKDYLGKAIAKRVIRLGGSQKEIGVSLGTSATTIGNILNGYYDRLSIRLYMRIARELDLEVDIQIKE